MKTILVVDDSKTFLTLAKQTLESEYHVMPILSGQQALKFLEKKCPDLILLDIKMPEMDGRETMRHIKEIPECADIPVIFLTASVEPETEVECLELGAVDFITKPFVPEVMKLRVERTLELQEYRRIAEQKAKRFENIASTDSLTGLINRACISAKTERLLSEGKPLAYLMIDVDHFKSVNDTLGHIMGDTVLKQLADTLKESFMGQLVGRIGGDEFVVVIANPPDREILSRQIEEVQAKVNAGFEKTTGGIATISVGIAMAPTHGMSFRELYDNADKALYSVKKDGKNGYSFCDSTNADPCSGKPVNTGTATDMQLLLKQLHEQDNIQGAYWQEYEPFLAIYQFMMRKIVRQKGCFTLALITVSNYENATPPPDQLKLCMESLHTIIMESIRKDDVFTSYSSAQYIILLSNTTAEATEDKVISRIQSQFDLQCGIMSVRLLYELSGLSYEEIGGE